MGKEGIRARNGEEVDGKEGWGKGGGGRLRREEEGRERGGELRKVKREVEGTEGVGELRTVWKIREGKKG